MNIVGKCVGEIILKTYFRWTLRTCKYTLLYHVIRFILQYFIPQIVLGCTFLINLTQSVCWFLIDTKADSKWFSNWWSMGWLLLSCGNRHWFQKTTRRTRIYFKYLIDGALLDAAKRVQSFELEITDSVTFLCRSTVNIIVKVILKKKSGRSRKEYLNQVGGEVAKKAAEI